jgi:hypothetical protein
MPDPFDLQMNQVATVMTRVASTAGGYGGTASFTNLTPTWPCRVAEDSLPSDKEFLAKSKEGIAYKKVFGRLYVDSNGNPLNHDHWLQITMDGTTKNYDIFQIHDPGGMGHHLEVECRVVDP